MRFVFTDDQQQLRAALRDLLDKECSAGHVRAMWSDEGGRPPALWGALADMGVVGLTVPEEDGGLGLTDVELALLLEEAGRAALPDPLLETSGVAVPLLVAAGAHEWLQRVARGDAIVAVGLSQTAYVVDAHVADLLLLQHEDELHAVPPADVALTAQPSVDRARHRFSVEWRPSSATRLLDGDRGRDALAAAFDRGALGAASFLCGLADRMIEMAALHARQRHQFGRPIGSFQAVKHLLADALLPLDFARPVVHRAAWSVAHDDVDRPVHVSMAKAYASDAATGAARAALQVHGAIGYTWEHDLHLWMKRAWALAAAWGDAGWHRARVGEWVLGPE